MLGSFALGTTTLGDIISTALTPYIPVSPVDTVGDVAIIAVVGDITVNF